MIKFPLVGNEKIKNALLNAIRENRLPHSIIIEGEDGSGKHTLADFIAKAIVCESGEKPCGGCHNCSLVNSSNHPDILSVSPAEKKKNISVDQIREIRQEAYVKPHTAKGKVLIIDPADSMNPQAQNALLKVLEEPPQGVYFILIAQNKSAFLETVISRCIVFSLSAAEESLAAEYISSNTEYPKSDIISALKEAKNNIGKALLLLSGKADSKAAILAKDFLRYMDSEDMWAMLECVSALEKNRLLADSFFKELKELTALTLQKNLNSSKAKKLFKLYNELSSLEKSLELNINLNLLNCLLVCTAVQINEE